MENRSNIKETIEKYKRIYQNIRPTYSPAIDEKIYFNMSGFNHLIFKKGHRRKNDVIYTRMVLIPLIKPVIKNCEEVTEIRKRIERIGNKDVKVVYKALEARVGKSSTRVKVVTKRIGDKGKYYFQSIMKYN